ncbi:MAG TPA: hypothetical protein VGS22_28675 [Thermoanaerobaculia bacterium]|nr:hypothetical protein [Thermoanaerobaculia bacterium]
MRERLGLGELLDRAANLVARELPERAALGILAALPWRLLQVWWFHRLAELGATATQHGKYLISLSLWTVAALPLAFWGRAQLARGCSIALSGEDGSLSRSRFGLPWRTYLAGLYAALVAAALYPAIGWMIFPLPLVALYSGLAAATAPYQERPGIWAPLATAARGFGSPRLLAGLWFTASVGVLIAVIQLFVLFQLGFAAVQTMFGDTNVWWERTLSPDNRLFVLLLFAGACLAVEPFWIAGLSIVVQRGRARASGDDLAGWIAELAEATELNENATENAA